MINHREIQYLLTICEEKSISAAARKLYISQPALSKMITKLEEEIGASLFIRESGGVYLTNEGKIYIDGCLKVKGIYDSVQSEIADLQDDKKGKITLGISSRTSSFILPPVLEAFKQAYPLVELSLVEENIAELEQLAITGQVDLALTYYNTNPNLEYKFLAKDPVYLVAPPMFYHSQTDWRFGIENALLNPKELEGKPMILLKKGKGMRKIADMFFTQNAVSPQIILETNSIHLAYNLVQENKGFTFLPGVAVKSLHQLKPGVFYQMQDYMMERNFYACFRKGSYLSTSIRYLIQLIARLL